MLFAWSCKKEDAIVDGPDKSGPLKYPSCTEAQPTSATVLELMKNPDDASDERMNEILYHYAQALRKAMTDPTKRCQVINALLATPGGEGEISLLKYANDNPSTFGNTFNADIKTSIGESNAYPKAIEANIETLVNDASWDANTFLRNKMERGDYKYEPAISFIKVPENCDLSKDIVIVIGSDVNNCDDVAGWRGNREILMGEAEAISTSDIVIFVGVDERGDAVISSIVGNNNDDPSIIYSGEVAVEERDGPGKLIVDAHQIYERFESGSNKSEVMGFTVIFTPTATERTNTNHGFVQWEDFDPRKIHKDDVGAGSSGTFYTDDKQLVDEIDASFFPLFNFGMHMVVYEHDWYAPKKVVKNFCDTDNVFNLDLRRKYIEEIYLNDCTGNAAVWYGLPNESVDFLGANGRFIIKRTI